MFLSRFATCFNSRSLFNNRFWSSFRSASRKEYCKLLKFLNFKICNIFYRFGLWVMIYRFSGTVHPHVSWGLPVICLFIQASTQGLTMRIWLLSECLIHLLKLRHSAPFHELLYHLLIIQTVIWRDGEKIFVRDLKYLYLKN